MLLDFLARFSIGMVIGMMCHINDLPIYVAFGATIALFVLVDLLHAPPAE